MAKKTGIKLSGNYGDAPIPAAKKIVYKIEDDIEDGLPRYDKPGFHMIETPDSTGMIRAYRGAKLFEDGIVRYPSNAFVNRDEAAKVQAYMDYNHGNHNHASYREDMYAIYGEVYMNEFKRLCDAKQGPSAWKQ